MTLEQFKSRLREHDWYYACKGSDHPEFLEGRRDREELERVAKKGGTPFKQEFNKTWARKFLHLGIVNINHLPFPDAKT